MNHIQLESGTRTRAHQNSPPAVGTIQINLIQSSGLSSTKPMISFVLLVVKVQHSFKYLS